MVKLFALISILIAFPISAQVDLSGNWQGILQRDGMPNDKSVIIYATFTLKDGILEGKTRNEIYETDLFAVKKIKGTSKEKQLTFSEYVIEKKKNSSQTNWCNIKADLIYNDSTGYLKGRYSSSDCKRNTGQLILFRSKSAFSATEISPMSHSWYISFLTDLKKGYNAPEIREKERNEFIFQPIYFDTDKSEIRTEYYAFLKKMIRVVDGHTDLRIKVTGHTDGDGSDSYNQELSRKRAEAIVNFFVSQGLSKDRIVIDFKGEKEPIDSNVTPEGKQHNRRVDFSFI